MGSMQLSPAPVWSTSMKTVLTYGTFDLFHVGHVNMLERARACGDRLIVGVSTDEFNQIKGKKAIIPYMHRAAIVLNSKSVDSVFPEDTWEQKVTDIKKYHADVFVMGADWEGKFDHLTDLCQVVYLPRTEGVSSTELRARLAPLNTSRLAELKLALETVAAIAGELQ